MKATIDSGGRLLLPKAIRDALGLAPGSEVDVSPYGGAVQITPGGRTARIEREPSGRLVARGERAVSDEEMYALLDASRR